MAGLKENVQASKRIGLYERYIKRLMDFTLALISIIILAPILITVAILVRVKLGSPVIFKQQRPGLNEEIFTICKFRTMTDEKDESGNLLPDKLRLTKFGRFLRSTSLDELPELFNILKGEMSIVGPRPLHVRYLPLYNEVQKLRHIARPGLTGLAQINGRNAISWEEKFELDVQYVSNITFWNDVKIIIKTFISVIKRDGINSSADATMPAFTGTKKSGNA